MNSRNYVSKVEAKPWGLSKMRLASGKINSLSSQESSAVTLGTGRTWKKPKNSVPGSQQK